MEDGTCAFEYYDFISLHCRAGSSNLLIKLIFLNWNRDFFSIGQALSPHENIRLVKFHEEKEDEKMGYYILVTFNQFYTINSFS